MTHTCLASEGSNLEGPVLPRKHPWHQETPYISHLAWEHLGIPRKSWNLWLRIETSGLTTSSMLPPWLRPGSGRKMRCLGNFWLKTEMLPLCWLSLGHFWIRFPIPLKKPKQNRNIANYNWTTFDPQILLIPKTGPQLNHIWVEHLDQRANVSPLCSTICLDCNFSIQRESNHLPKIPIVHVLEYIPSQPPKFWVFNAKDHYITNIPVMEEVLYIFSAQVHWFWQYRHKEKVLTQ